MSSLSLYDLPCCPAIQQLQCRVSLSVPLEKVLLSLPAITAVSCRRCTLLTELLSCISVWFILISFDSKRFTCQEAFISFTWYEKRCLRVFSDNDSSTDSKLHSHSSIQA